MKQFDLVLDGSNLFLHGVNERNQATTVIRLQDFTVKLEFFLCLGYRPLLCFDCSTLDKIEKGQYTIDGTLKQLEGILKSHGGQFIQSDYQMAEFALKYGVPIVTNDKFKGWCDGSETNKRSQVSREEWAVIKQQSIGHSMDKKGRFKVKPPLKNKKYSFSSESRANQMAHENLQLKSEVESLRRQKELQSATIASLRRCMNIG